jgi:flagellar biogenesis protein FliO
MDAGFIFRIIWAFALVGLLLVGLTYVVRTLARGRLVVAANRKLVTVVESTFLAQNVTVHVIKVADKFFLVGGGASGVTKIDEVPAETAQAWLDEQKRTLTGQRETLTRALARLRRS